jgi:hypothetical protein
MQKAEFMSATWIDMARSQIEATLAKNDLRGVRYTLCEEFTDPPVHLQRPGRATVGFYVRVDDGKVEVGDHPIEDAELKIVSDYKDALAIARDPDVPAADPQVMAERIAEGRLQIIGNPMDAPPVLRELDIHRLLAAQTS